MKDKEARERIAQLEKDSREYRIRFRRLVSIIKPRVLNNKIVAHGDVFYRNDQCKEDAKTCPICNWSQMTKTEKKGELFCHNCSSKLRAR